MKELWSIKFENRLTFLVYLKDKLTNTILKLIDTLLGILQIFRFHIYFLKLKTVNASYILKLASDY